MFLSVLKNTKLDITRAMIVDKCYYIFTRKDFTKKYCTVEELKPKNFAP